MTPARESQAQKIIIDESQGLGPFIVRAFRGVITGRPGEVIASAGGVLLGKGPITLTVK